MDLRKIRNEKVVIPKKRTKEFSIYTGYAFYDELDENGNKYEGCQKIVEETNSVYLGIKGEVAKDGYPICYGFSPIPFVHKDNTKFIFMSWTDKDENLLHYFTTSKDSPAYYMSQETASGANYAGVRFENDVIYAMYLENGLEKVHNLGKDEIIIDYFEEFDARKDKSSQIVCVKAKPCSNLTDGQLMLSPNTALPYKLYVADGSIYISNPDTQDFTKIGEDKAFVEERIKMHKEMLKKFKLDNFNKVTKKFDFNIQERTK